MTAEEPIKPSEAEAIFSHQIELSPGERRRKTVDANLERLAQRKERGEVSEQDFEAQDIYSLKNGLLTREAVGNRAVVITQQDLEDLSGITMRMDNGEEIYLDPDSTGYEPGDTLVIWPEDLG